MPKQLLSEPRFGWRSGLNTVHNPDELNVDELRECKNARVSGEVGTLGAVLKRTGSRKMHSSALASGSAITGVTQWVEPSGGKRQIVAIADGKLYYRNEGGDAFSGSFTEVSPSPAFSTSTPQRFATFRSTSTNAQLRLYIADGSVVYEWDGTSLSRIDGSNSIPSAELLVPYHTRMFYNDPQRKKHIVWSKIGDATDAQVVALDVSSGGEAIVDVLSGQAITALAVAGGALLIATEDSVVRFIGYSSEDIRVEQDTEGLSPTIGIPGPNAVANVEKFAALVSELGPYIASESDLQAIGLKVEDQFDALDRDRLDEASVALHKGRREVWFAVPATDDTDLQTVYVYSLRLSAWSGPFKYPFSFQSIAPFEDPLGDEYIMAAGSDGYLRHLDVGAVDDAASDGSGGSSYAMRVEFAPVFFEAGPGRVKALKEALLQAEIASNVSLYFEVAPDRKDFSTYSVDGLASGKILDYRRGVGDHGRRFRLRVQDDGSASIPSLHGFLLEAHNMTRY